MTKIKTIYNLKTIFIMTSVALIASTVFGQMLKVGHLQVSASELEQTLSLPSSVAGFVMKGETGSPYKPKFFHLTANQYPKNDSRGLQLTPKCDCVEFRADYSKDGSKQDRMTVDVSFYSQPGYAMTEQNFVSSSRQSTKPLPTGSFTEAKLGAFTWHSGGPGHKGDAELFLIAEKVRIDIYLTNIQDTAPGEGVAFRKFDRGDALAIDKLAKTTLERAKRLAQKM